jgi:uncharacterized protein (TIGR02145 family)
MKFGIGWFTLIIILFCGISCDMRWHLDEMQRIPVVKTGEVSNIRNTMAVVAGNVEWDGDALLTERGICYSESAVPTISDEHVTAGNTEGDFSAQITGLTRNTAYRARAYAINEIGVAYGSLVFFTTADVLDTIPALTTLQATEIAPSSARVGGEITSDGGNEILERGICYSLEAAPDTSDAIVTTGGGDAPYSDVLTGLEDGATYFARAYAINDLGIGYGNEISFQTPLQGLPVVITMDANVNGATTASLSGNVTSEGDSPVVTRGICYSTEPQPDANDIVIASGSGAGFFNCTLSGLQENTTYYARAFAANSIGSVYGNEVSFTTPVGAVSSIICDATFVIGSYVQGLQVSNGSLNIYYTGGNGGAYASQTFYSTGVVGLVASLAGGNFDIGSGNLLLNISGVPLLSGAAIFSFVIGGQSCTFTIQVEAGSVGSLDCESTVLTGNYVEGFPVSNGSFSVSYIGGSGGGFNSQSVISTGVTGLTATLPSGVFNQNGGTIIFLVSGTPYEAGIASFNVEVGGQECVIQISVRLPSQHTCGAINVHNENLTYGSMTDQEGNLYRTIIIGSQEWMAENLNTGIYANGDPITTGLNYANWGNTTEGAWSGGPTECPYGRLYNWYACVDSRDLCPTGWHIPNDNEWLVLRNYLGGENVAGGKMKSIGIQYWTSPNTSASNSSGFSGLPAGSRATTGIYTAAGGGGSWWSSSVASSTNAGTFSTDNTTAALWDNAWDKNLGLSVRCLKD